MATVVQPTQGTTTSVELPSQTTAGDTTVAVPQGASTENRDRGGPPPTGSTPHGGGGNKRKRKKGEKKNRTRRPDYDSLYDTQSSEDTEDENIRHKGEIKRLTDRVNYLEPREGVVSQATIEEAVNTRTRSLQQTISQKSQAETQLRKERDELRAEKERSAETAERLRTEREEARADANRARKEREDARTRNSEICRERDDFKNHLELGEKKVSELNMRIADLITSRGTEDDRTQGLVDRCIAAEVALAAATRVVETPAAPPQATPAEQVDFVNDPMEDAAPEKTKEALEILRRRDAALEEARAADPHTALTPVAASIHAKDHEEQRTAAVALNLPTVAESKATANKVPPVEKKIGKKKDAAKAPEAVVRKRRSSGGSSSSKVPPPGGLSPNTMLALAEAKGRTNTAKAKTAVKPSLFLVEEVAANEAKPDSKVTTESKETKEVDWDSDTPIGSPAELEGLEDLGDPKD
jgi:hypothetical protein